MRGGEDMGCRWRMWGRWQRRHCGLLLLLRRQLLCWLLRRGQADLLHRVSLMLRRWGACGCAEALHVQNKGHALSCCNTIYISVSALSVALVNAGGFVREYVNMYDHLYDGLTTCKDHPR